VRESLSLSQHQGHENHGDILVLRIDRLSAEERLLLQTAARAVIVSSGHVAEQLLRHPRPSSAFVAPKPTPYRSRFAAVGDPPLEFFNGLGGFAEAGREYVIVLDKGQWTPAPWINVIANPTSASWSRSWQRLHLVWQYRENQLTPWSNDPVTDPPGEVFYLRDDETDELWVRRDCRSGLTMPAM